jgi:hypothetical protein
VANDIIAIVCPIPDHVRAIRARRVVKQPSVEVRWVRAVVGLDKKRFGRAQVTVGDRDIHGVRSMSTCYPVAEIALPRSIFDVLAFAKDGMNPGLLNGQCFQLCGALLVEFEDLVRNRR